MFSGKQESLLLQTRSASPRMWGTVRRERDALEHVAVHPHVCGEQRWYWYRRRHGCGSSPRMWGTAEEIAYGGNTYRFIPTYVGNRQVRLIEPKSHAGSSPRMWGTATQMTPIAKRRRFIPTYVGNRPRAALRSLLISVHPHVCGEQGGKVVDDILKVGSSPRMWGTGAFERR